MPRGDEGPLLAAERICVGSGGLKEKASSGSAAGWEGGSPESERKAYRGHDHRPGYTLTASTTYHIGCCSTVAPNPACNSIFSAARGV